MAQIIQFPKRNTGRVRKSESIQSGGVLAMKVAGDHIPLRERIAVFPERNKLDGLTRTPELALLCALFAKLPSEIARPALVEVGRLAERSPHCEATRLADALADHLIRFHPIV